MKNDYTYIAHLAHQLIQAMVAETEAMPKSFEAPKTVDAAGILRARLEALGFRFGDDKGSN